MPRPTRRLHTPQPLVPRNTDALTLARSLAHAAETRQGEEIQILEISKVSSIGDYFVIVSGDNERHVGALYEAIVETAKNLGVPAHHIEGETESRWVLLDFIDVVVHIFVRDLRNYYNIDRLWADAPEVSV